MGCDRLRSAKPVLRLVQNALPVAPFLYAREIRLRQVELPVTGVARTIPHAELPLEPFPIPFHQLLRLSPRLAEGAAPPVVDEHILQADEPVPGPSHADTEIIVLEKSPPEAFVQQPDLLDHATSRGNAKKPEPFGLEEIAPAPGRPGRPLLQDLGWNAPLGVYPLLVAHGVGNGADQPCGRMVFQI